MQMPHLTHFQAFLCLVLIFIFVWMVTIDLKLSKVVKHQKLIERLLNIMALDFSKLQTAVANEVTVEQSAITLITTIAGEIAANANDQQTVSDLADKLNQAAAGLSAAITANTPAAPASTSTPVAPVPPTSPAAPTA